MKEWGSGTGKYYVDQSYEFLQGWITGKTNDTDFVSTSEAHGYGMVINAMVAPYLDNDDTAKTYFDGMYNLYKLIPSTLTGAPLMSWVVPANKHAGNLTTYTSDTATDGDIDVAYGLFLAHKTWGSTGTINYIAECEKVIKAIAAREMDFTYNITLLGDWAKDTVENPSPNSRFKYGSRPCDWMGGKLGDMYVYFRDQGISIGYGESFLIGLEDNIFNGTDSTTGLTADFVWIDHLNGGTELEPVPSDGTYFEQPNVYDADPADPYFMEAAFDDAHNWNSCRFPLRMANSRRYYWKGYRTNTQDVYLGIVSNWIYGNTNTNPKNVKSGYNLNGTGLNSEKGDGSFASPMIAAAVASYRDDYSKSALFVSRGWTYWTDGSCKGLYFDDSITLQSMFSAEGWYRAALTRTPTRNDSPWTPNTFYSVGDVVSYNGSNWKCTFAHTAYSHWYPGAPGLWFWNKM